MGTSSSILGRRTPFCYGLNFNSV